MQIPFQDQYHFSQNLKLCITANCTCTLRELNFADFAVFGQIREN